MTTLYRKYRPQTFSQVVNQNHIKMTLEREIADGQLAHAYIFCGPRGIGKTTLARIFAKAVNCEEKKNGQSEPCNKCPSCLEITQNRSLDIVEIDAASHTGVDNVRENIIASARVSPSRLSRKIFIIDEVHMLSASAFNALLKTIEEPAETSIFILCTTEAHKVPLTIISRCQRFDFKKIGATDIVKKLAFIAEKEEVEISKNILEDVARRSEGHLRDAESYLGQLFAVASGFGEKKGKKISEEEAALVIPRSGLDEIIGLIGHLNKRDAGGAIRLVNSLIDEGVELKNFCGNAIEILRKFLLAKVNPGLAPDLALELGEQAEIRLATAGSGLTAERIITMIEKLMEARNEIKNSFIIQLPLELAIIKICSVPDGLKEFAEKTVFSPPETKPEKPGGKLSNPVRPAQIKPEKNGEKAVLGSEITKNEVMGKWNEVLARVKKYNHSLSFILRVCEPRSISGSTLCLAFKYKFHKSRIDDPTVRALVEKSLKEVYNFPLMVRSVVDEKIAADNPQTEPGGPLNSENTDSLPKSLGTKAPEVKKTPEGGEKTGDIMTNLLKTFGGRIVG